MLGLSKEILYVPLCLRAVKLQPDKVGNKKNLRHFGFEATFYVVVHGRILTRIHEFKVDKLWAPTALLPLDIKKPKVPHLKFKLISI